MTKMIIMKKINKKFKKIKKIKSKESNNSEKLTTKIKLLSI